VLKVDLHLHTSDDPVDRIAYSSYDLIDRAATHGFGALAITLHDRQRHHARLAAYARERGIVLLPGIERTVRGRHVLLINFPADAVRAVQTLDDVARLRQSANGLVIAPHPFFPGSTCLRSALDAHADAFDAIEWSYFWTPLANFNARGAAWAARHGKPVVGNSDLHDIRGFGRTYSLVDAPPDPDAICESIRGGRVQLCTSPAPVFLMADIFLRMQMNGLVRKPADAPDRARVGAGSTPPATEPS
jgi:predicted metal-dependent phosphoesterase TrpH